MSKLQEYRRDAAPRDLHHYRMTDLEISSTRAHLRRLSSWVIVNLCRPRMIPFHPCLDLLLCVLHCLCLRIFRSALPERWT